MREDRSDEETSDQESEEEEELDTPELKKTRNRALNELRFRVEQAIRGNYLISRKNRKSSPDEKEDLKDIKLWGVPLLPKESHEGTNTVLMKFLKAKHYKVHEAFMLLRRTLKWRADFRPGDDLMPDFDNLWFTSGRDKEGRPICYNVLGKESYKKMLIPGDQKYQNYLRWRVFCVEKGIQSLDFRPGEADSIIQIIDLKNAPGQAMKEVKLICKSMINLLHDHYPGVVYKNLVINVPYWFMTFNALNLRLITQRSKNKFIFVKPSRVTDTLLKYATIENIPVQYGGLERENDADFSTDDKVLEANIRASTTEFIQIPANELGVTLTWDVTVLGYEVAYKEEFIPDDDCSYRILLQEKKMKDTTRNSFHIREPGKIVITIVNASYTKKKAFYRYKSRPSIPMYMFIKS